MEQWWNNKKKHQIIMYLEKKKKTLSFFAVTRADIKTSITQLKKCLEHQVWQ